MANVEIRRSQWIELSARSLRHNLGVIRRILGSEILLAAVVKAKAYGHGLLQVAPLALQTADWLAVHTADEAREIRRIGLDAPVLIMGFVPPAELYDLDSSIHIFVSTEEVLTWLGDYRRKSGISLPVHLKVNTGTHRQGFATERLSAVCRSAASQGLTVVGLATHFANIEDTLEHQFAQQQLDDFRCATEAVKRELGEDPPFVHAACSAAALLFPESDFTMARIGISMYGHWPSRETRLTWTLDHGRKGLNLEPALSWHAVVGDPAVLLGRQDDLEVTAEELAELSGTINYEFLARLATGISRTVVDRPDSGGV
jgi:alanine racemase